MTIPLIAIPGPPAVTTETLAGQSEPGLVVPTTGAAVLTEGTFLSAAQWSSAMEQLKTGLALIWLLGSISVLAWSLVRIFRFNRLLGMASGAAPPQVQESAATIAHRLGMAAAPTIYTTSARISPLVWWLGGKVRILIPAAMSRRMDADQLQWILAHELAHVRRKDHLVRWLEWLACSLFWWNPVVWWARRHLRANEEVCCDALVLSSLKPAPRTYASSLMTVVEYLASPALRPPAMASEINSGGFLERRFKMIVSDKPNPRTSRWLYACILLCAALILPLGLAQGQDYEKIGKRLKKAVKKGEITQEHADIMMTALRKAAHPDDGARRITREEYARIEGDLKKAVADGRISEEDAKARLDGMRRELAAQAERERAAGPRRRIGELLERFDTDKDGSLTEREAGEHWPRISPTDADEDGKVTGREMYAAWSKDDDRARGERRISREDYARIEADLRKLVEEGRISEEDARIRLEGA